jgi:hypothetical protein
VRVSGFQYGRWSAAPNTVMHPRTAIDRQISAPEARLYSVEYFQNALFEFSLMRDFILYSNYLRRLCARGGGDYLALITVRCDYFFARVIYLIPFLIQEVVHQKSERRLFIEDS